MMCRTFGVEALLAGSAVVVMIGADAVTVVVVVL